MALRSVSSVIVFHWRMFLQSSFLSNLLARSVVVLFKFEITLHSFVIQLYQEYLYSFLLENSCSSI